MGYAHKSELADLRQIGWDHWDPIGIRRFGTDDWRGPAADEYDAYMRHVAQLLRSGLPRERAIAYLNQIASVHMGLGPSTAEGVAASERTVDAVVEYLRRSGC